MSKREEIRMLRGDLGCLRNKTQNLVDNVSKLDWELHNPPAYHYGLTKGKIKVFGNKVISNFCDWNRIYTVDTGKELVETTENDLTKLLNKEK